MKLDFRTFIIEGGQGSGTKFSSTGLNAGGQAQAGMGMSKPAQPQKVPPSEFNPSDVLPPGYKPAGAPGSGNDRFPVEKRQVGMSGAGERPPYQPIGKPASGPFGGGCPGCGQAKMKVKMKKAMKK